MKKQTRKKEAGFVTDRIADMVLCAFFGIFGAHKFRQGKIKTGILFIILDLTIIGILATMICSFVDLVLMTIDRNNSKNEFALGLVLLVFMFAWQSSIGRSRYIIENKIVAENTVGEAKSNPPQPDKIIKK